MKPFHDNKLWQDAYVAVMDVHQITDSNADDITGAIRRASRTVLTTVADAVTRKDRRQQRDRLQDALGAVASIRSLLSVAWGQQVLPDDVFKKLDESYETLGKQLTK